MSKDIEHIEGSCDDYEVSSQDLLATGVVYAFHLLQGGTKFALFCFDSGCVSIAFELSYIR